MAYCTLGDIREEIDQAVLVELTDDPEIPTGDIIEANVTSAIERADALINGFLSAKMSVPAKSSPTLLTLSVDLAIYTLFSRKESVPEIREERYIAAMRFLRAFSQGDVSIGVISDPTASYPIYSAPLVDFDSTVWDKY